MKLAEGDISVYRFSVGFGFVQTLGIGLVAGRDFSREISSDATDAVLINETLARRLGWDEVVGRRLSGLDYADAEGRYQGPSLIVGVVEDLHLYSLHRKIPPALK